MFNTITTAILELNIFNELIVVILAATPISELRGAIPLAISSFEFTWYYAYLLAVIGNMIPVPFILLFLTAFTRLLSRFSIFKKFFDWLFERTKNKSDLIQKYKGIGLILFVAIPLPITGAWTGSIAAVLLGIGFKEAFFPILAGVLIAGVIVTCLTLLGWAGAIIAGTALCGVALFGFIKKKPSD